jgi:hypothetical protein
VVDTAYKALVTVIMQVSEIEYAPAFKSRRRQVDTFWYEVLVGDRLPTAKPRRLTPCQHFLRKVVMGLLEIDRTIRLLHEIAFYAAHAPRYRNGPSKVSFLNYHIESHLHETYILRERIESFLTFLERAYRKDKSERRIGVITKRIRRAVGRVLGPIANARSRHVHVERLRVPDIERLEFVEDTARLAPEELQSKFVLQFESAYRSIRRPAFPVLTK